jgi:recombination protein RecA
MAEEKLGLKDLITKINKNAGHITISRASVVKGMDVPRISTGIFAIDQACGGVPYGRITGIFGKKSSCKSSVCLKTIASAQQYCRNHMVRCVETGKRLYRCPECGFRGDKEGDVCPDCEERDMKSVLIDRGDMAVACPVCKKYDPMITAWLDLEASWLNKWSSAMGVNCHNVYVIRPDSAEQAIDIAESLLYTKEVDILVIDTLAHLTPSVEIEESLFKNQMGLQARLINKSLRKLVTAIESVGVNRQQKVTIIALNQVRMKLGILFGDPETKPGGMGQDFATSLDLKFWPGKYAMDKIGNTDSLAVNFKVVKNKVSRPNQQGNFRFWVRDVDNYHCGDTDELGVVIGFAFKSGLLGEAGKWGYGDKKFKTKEELIQYIATDQKIFREIRNKLNDMPLGTIVSDEESLKIKDDDE